MIHSYPSIYNLGHKAVLDIFTSPVVVQEKVDGSQFSFGVYNDDSSPSGLSLRCRSKGAEIQVLAPDEMFAKAVETAQELEPFLHPGWTYRAEYLAKPKHNALVYDRVPTRHLILFDVDLGNEDYLIAEGLRWEANRLGLECVPVLREGIVANIQDLRELLDTTSVLGGQKVEGIVVKNYSMFGVDKKILMAKFVSETFKEVHAAEWKSSNPSSGDIIDNLIAQYRTPARWTKAVQHLREAGKLEDTPRDIGLLFKEVPEDLKGEEMDAIKDKLFAWAWPKVQRGACAGLAEWYKEELLKRQFQDE